MTPTTAPANAEGGDTAPEAAKSGGLLRAVEGGGDVAAPAAIRGRGGYDNRLTRIILWRHGRTAWNAAGRVQGQLEVDLDEVGVAQAAAAAPRAAGYRPDLVICSDLRRTRRTVAALVALTGTAVEYDERLRERYFGEWQGLDRDQIRERYPIEYDRWSAWEEPLGADFVEPMSELTKRMASVVREAAERVGPGGTALLVSHGAAIRAGIIEVLGWAHDEARALGALRNCHFAELGQDLVPAWQLRALNVG